jgi:uncharacterized protein YfaS (alpha-2-macroglobulin family)
LEQRASKAIGLADASLWQEVMASLPAHLDDHGLAQYWPSNTQQGSEILTAYLLTVAHEAGYAVPEQAKMQMLAALSNVVEGRIAVREAKQYADQVIRKLILLETLSRYGVAKPGHWDNIEFAPQRWPTASVIDALGAVKRMPELKQRGEWLQQLRNTLRSRFDLQGTVLNLSRESDESYWWLMHTPDQNAIRALMSLFDDVGFKDDAPKLLRSVLARQKNGAWRTTTANAWGRLMLAQFANRYESVPVSGSAELIYGKHNKTIALGQDTQTLLPWASGDQALTVNAPGQGKPWIMVRSLASLPLKKPLFAGYQIERQVLPVEQKNRGQWTVGDVVEVRLTVVANSDMAWVVVDDPIPASSSILGTGLGGDSALQEPGNKADVRAWPAFTERTATVFKQYYRHLPKGSHVINYQLRLNQAGTFRLGNSHVEAMYAPEMFADMPVADVVIIP